MILRRIVEHQLLSHQTGIEPWSASSADTVLSDESTWQISAYQDYLCSFIDIVIFSCQLLVDTTLPTCIKENYLLTHVSYVPFL